MLFFFRILYLYETLQFLDVFWSVPNQIIILQKMSRFQLIILTPLSPDPPRGSRGDATGPAAARRAYTIAVSGSEPRQPTSLCPNTVSIARTYYLEFNSKMSIFSQQFLVAGNISVMELGSVAEKDAALDDGVLVGAATCWESGEAPEDVCFFPPFQLLCRRNFLFLRTGHVQDILAALFPSHAKICEKRSKF